MSVFMLFTEAKCIYEKRQTGGHLIWLILPDEGKGEGQCHVFITYFFMTYVFAGNLVKNPLSLSQDSWASRT